jgi:hypothetical protein
LHLILIKKLLFIATLYDNLQTRIFYKDIISDEWGTACSTRAFSGFPLGVLKNQKMSGLTRLRVRERILL